MQLPFARLGLAATLSACLCACDTGVDGDDGSTAPDAAPISPACQEATEHSDLAWIQDNVFTPSCALASACHQGMAQSAAGLNLEAGMSETNLVNVAAKAEGIEGEIFVVPGDSASSYLMVIIDHESKGGRLSGPLPPSGTMPFNNPLMCVEKRDAIARWIDSL